MKNLESYEAAINGLLEKAKACIDEVKAGVAAMVDLEAPDGSLSSKPPNDKPIFDAVRRVKGKALTESDVSEIKAAIIAAYMPPPDGPEVGLSDADFGRAALSLKCSVAQVRAVWEVECAGSGWFTDIRADILNLDGPGGFIHGSHLPKILFEAHKFARHTGHRFNASHPNLSSPKWNRALYKGGQGEWARLHDAMQLDRRAALMSASWGGPQILGENYKLAGFESVDDFVDAMMKSERAHLDAFVSFVANSGLSDELRRVSAKAADCAPFAEGYNGSGYATHNYHGKIAASFKKWNAR